MSAGQGTAPRNTLWRAPRPGLRALLPCDFRVGGTPRLDLCVRCRSATDCSGDLMLTKDGHSYRCHGDFSEFTKCGEHTTRAGCTAHATSMPHTRPSLILAHPFHGGRVSHPAAAAHTVGGAHLPPIQQ